MKNVTMVLNAFDLGSKYLMKRIHVHPLHKRFDSESNCFQWELLPPFFLFECF
jgi:hypothetical protein